MAEDLGFLARSAGIDAEPPAAAAIPPFLDDADLRKAAKTAYLRDYVAFGFGDRP